MKLSNLPGTNGREISCLFIDKGIEIDVVLRNGYAATSANNNGCINIWKDDEGNVRCEAARYMRTLESKTYANIKSAIKWADKWVKEIN